MRKTVYTIILAVLCLGSRLLSQEILDRVVAVIDDKIILQSELYQYSYSLAIQLGIDPQGEPEKVEKLRKETLDNLIAQKVLLVKAKEDSITVSEKEVDARLDEQIKQIVAQLGSESKVEEYFGLTLRQIKRDFRDEVRERLLVKTLQDRKFREIQITRREVNDFYRAYKDSLPGVKESVKISHILVHIEPSEATIRAAREKTEALLERLREGEDFASLAKEYSEDVGTAANGGETGFIQRGDFVKEYEEVAFLLKPGEISDIVRSRYGFHIIQLIAKRGEKVNTRHILIRLDTSPEDEQATKDKLLALKTKIESGEMTFAEAAEKYSKDETTASKGGKLGWFETDQFQLESFKKAVAGLKEGEISNPIKTQFGYHLVRLEKRKPARKLDIKRDWEQIENWALNIKRQNEFQRWVKSIRKDVYVDIKI